MTSPNLVAARLSLDGLALGDSFGQRFFFEPFSRKVVEGSRDVPPAPWYYTDDTQMAISIYTVLRNHEVVNQDALARSFASHYDVSRGYGAAMHSALARIRAGEPWSSVAKSLFEGSGSYGNGAAMRVAPIGAAFNEDLDEVIESARRSSMVTHTHREGVAGAIAVAVATAWAWRLGGSGDPPSVKEFVDLVLPHVPESETREGIVEARELPVVTEPFAAGQPLGNGARVTSQDTVPFCIFSAAKNLGDFEEAMWHTVSALGDCDTTCAIVGGIVAAFVGEEGLPSEWLDCREPLAEWRE